MHQLINETTKNQQDIEPPLSLFNILQYQNTQQQPQLIVNMYMKKSQYKVVASIYKDRFIVQKQGKKFYLLLDLQTFFGYSLKNYYIWFQSKQTNQRQQLFTFSQSDIELIVNSLKKKCPQSSVHCKYSNFKLLSKSKSSQVYLTNRIEDNEEYVVKIQKNGLKVKSQIQILGELNHPNVISFEEFFIQSQTDKTYTIFEYYDGGSLLQRISSQQKMEYKQKGKIVTDMLNALQFLRIKGIVHRDIKPQNILFCSKDQNYKLGDFGLAVRVKQKLSKISGTPGYIDPEFLKQNGGQIEANIKSDIYSLGLTFYEIFTKKRYFQGSNQNQILTQNSKGKSIKQSKLIKSDIQKKLLRMMIRAKPQNRLDSCQIMQSSAFKKLNRFIKIQSIKSQSSSQGGSQTTSGKNEKIKIPSKIQRVKTN